ncbi:MAG: SAM-dependent methyltransferase [Clostridia bacterium]|nr:SAM-dependent methyltransferase [Clostridia bacterium]
MQLSPRLLKIASLVPKCHTIADVGTDHGYIPLVCIDRGIASHAIAMDINPMPLKRAKDNFVKHGYMHQAQFRLSDGLAQLKSGEADVIVIAGMGGPLICDIIKNGAHAIDDNTLLLLQPMIAPIELRSFLFANGYRVCDEYVVREDNKYYNIMAVRKGEAQPTDELIYIGANLAANSTDTIGDYLDYKIRVCQGIIEGHSRSACPDAEAIEKFSHELAIYQSCKKELTK